MPCGGIHPIPIDFLQDGKPYSFDQKPTCWQCNYSVDKYDLFCDEWDCYLHYKCVPSFLMTEEGRLVIEHLHDIEAISRAAMLLEYQYMEQKEEEEKNDSTK